jgi:hypothetical protein
MLVPAGKDSGMHPLLKTTVRSTVITEAAYPSGAEYDFESGVWQGSNGPVCEDPSTMPMSKKADLETGEDQKGH